jgi:hypothetical protein
MKPGEKRLYSMITHCHICGGPAEVPAASHCHCFRCGDYWLSGECLSDVVFRSLTETQIANASGWLRRNQGTELTRAMLDFLAAAPAPTVEERAERLLLYLVSLGASPGCVFFFNLWEVDQLIERAKGTVETFDTDSTYLAKCEDVLPLLGHSASIGQNDLLYLIFDYLTNHKGYLGKGNRDGSFTITPIGWDFIGTFRFALPQTNQAFVAMWFDGSMHPSWTFGIRLGVEAAGYRAIRVDKQEHNNRIDDEIVAEIRKSKFTVADFTGQRGGVYFEAGFTLGLGRPVIWLCRDDALSEVHFDTRQYNFIVWTINDLDKLAKAIEHRIVATIGRGNYTRPISDG